VPDPFFRGRYGFLLSSILCVIALTLVTAQRELPIWPLFGLRPSAELLTSFVSTATLGVVADYTARLMGRNRDVSTV